MNTCCKHWQLKADICLFLYTYGELLKHPRMPKILMAECKRSIKSAKQERRHFNFGLLCNLMESAAIGVACQRLDGFRFHQYYGHFIGVMLRTIKYWKRKHFVYYFENHFDNMATLKSNVLPMEDMKAVNGKPSLPVVESPLVEHFVDGMQHFVTQRLSMDIETFLTEYKTLYKIFRDTTLNGSKCYYSDCNKRQSQQDRFKMCGGCKISYYCSRSCQKKAWSTHKVHCAKFIAYYKL